MKNWFQKAREAAGLSPEECASVLLDSHDSFARKEKNLVRSRLTSFAPCIASSMRMHAKSSVRHSATFTFNMHSFTCLTGIGFKEAPL